MMSDVLSDCATRLRERLQDPATGISDHGDMRAQIRAVALDMEAIRAVLDTPPYARPPAGAVQRLHAQSAAHALAVKLWPLVTDIMRDGHVIERWEGPPAGVARATVELTAGDIRAAIGALPVED